MQQEAHRIIESSGSPTPTPLRFLDCISFVQRTITGSLASQIKMEEVSAEDFKVKLHRTSSLQPIYCVYQEINDWPIRVALSTLFPSLVYALNIAQIETDRLGCFPKTTIVMVPWMFALCQFLQMKIFLQSIFRYYYYQLFFEVFIQLYTVTFLCTCKMFL